MDLFFGMVVLINGEQLYLNEYLTFVAREITSDMLVRVSTGAQETGIKLLLYVIVSVMICIATFQLKLRVLKPV